jgi:glycosyltransferase involved in cell wall biosynthesis
LDLPAPSPSPEEARVLQGLEKNRFYLLFFGQIKESKGLDILLEAMNLVHDPDIHLVIAGSAQDVDPQDLIESLVEPDVQIRIHLHHRYISDQERDSWFKACDAMILPYRRIYNSGVLMMALSYGKTVIASDLQANREIIQNGVNGYLFENGNAHDLAQNILRLKNASNRPNFEAIMNPLRTNHSWDLMAQQMKPFLGR